MASSTVAYLFGGVMLYMALWYFYKPVRWLMGLAIKTAKGCLGLILLNLFSGMTGLSIGVNLVTAFVVGMLGLPGLVMMIVLKTTV